MKIKYNSLIFFLFATIQTAISINFVTKQWKSYKIKHRKIYANRTDDIIRMQIFANNLQKIRKHNQLFAAGKVLYEKGVNQFTDMIDEEIIKITRSYKSDKLIRRTKSNLIQTFSDQIVGSSSQSVPKELDWRKSGLVTSVKNQEKCGSCWAFSTAGALEGLFAKNNKTKESISAQNLIDCSSSKKYGNRGCSGGNMNRAFQYVYDNNGVNLEGKYSYEGKDQKPCRYDSTRSPGFVTKLKLIPEDEKILVKYLATYGPVSAAMDATNLHEYAKGIYKDDKCDPDDINHAVLIVGYGTDSKTNKDYWLVKNSWGENWGENGYFRTERGGNHCGIANDATVPIKAN